MNSESFLNSASGRVGVVCRYKFLFVTLAPVDIADNTLLLPLLVDFIFKFKGEEISKDIVVCSERKLAWVMLFTGCLGWFLLCIT